MSADVDTIREKIKLFVCEGFRDEDGVWHDGPHKLEALAALDRLAAAEAQRDTLAEALDMIASGNYAETAEDVACAALAAVAFTEAAE